MSEVYVVFKNDNGYRRFYEVINLVVINSKLTITYLDCSGHIMIRELDMNDIKYFECHKMI